jgi:predicted DNA-binding protein (UPF0251 family)
MQGKHTAAVAARFWAKVDRRGSFDGCWLWMGHCMPKGYGQVRVDGRVQLAHRYSWELCVGPIPSGRWVLHNCPGGDNPGCVNPLHLWLGTAADNSADMVRKGRSTRGDRNPSRLYPERLARGDRSGAYTHPERVARGEQVKSAKLTEADIRVIRLRYVSSHVSPGKLAREYGVHRDTIARIVQGKRWAHIV